MVILAVIQGLGHGCGGILPDFMWVFVRGLREESTGKNVSACFISHGLVYEAGIYSQVILQPGALHFGMFKLIQLHNVIYYLPYDTSYHILYQIQY